MIHQEKCTVKKNKQIYPGYYHLVVNSREISKKCVPGQFANIRLSRTMDPLLRRPLSFYDFGDGNLEFVYKVVGYGTELLSEKSKGDSLDIMGPLGNGFVTKHVRDEQEVLIIGGGMGIIPLYSLISMLKEQGKKFSVINGARCAGELIIRDRIDEKEVACSYVSDDGSYARKGFVTDVLEEKLRKHNNYYIFACGPKPMLKAVYKFAQQYDVSAQVSLEEKMACGIGACIGCVVEDVNGNYKKVCKDGPVFDSRSIKWDM